MADADRASYMAAPELELNLRGARLNDRDGAAPRQYDTALPMPRVYNRPVGRPDNYTEGTLAASDKPLASVSALRHLRFRPEVRIDCADHPTRDGVTNRYQFAAGIEAYHAL